MASMGSGLPHWARRLVLSAVAVAVALTVALVVSRVETRQLRRNAIANLSAIAALKAGEIEAWGAEREGDVEVASNIAAFASVLARADTRRERGWPLGPGALVEALDRLESLKRSYGYRDVSLFDDRGELRLATDDDPSLKSPRMAARVRSALVSRGAMRNRPRWDDADQLVVGIGVIVPFGASAGSTLGAVVLRVDPVRTLWPLLAKWPTDSLSAALSVILPGPGDGSALVVSGRARDGGGAIERRRFKLSLPVMEAMAVAAGDGWVVANDVDGVPVLAAVRKPDRTNTMVVAKMALAEVDAPARRDPWLAFGGVLLLMGGVFAIARGVVRRQTESTIATSEEKFRNIFEAMQEGYIASVMDGTILLVNPAAVAMLGYRSSAEVVGKNMAVDVFADPQERARIIETLKRKGTVQAQPCLLRRANGEVFQIEANIRLVLDDQGRPFGLEGIVRDMTAHYQRQAELIRAREAAIEASAVKSRFLANMSHEIRTPLNAIVGLSHLLARERLSAPHRDYVDKIHAAAGMLMDVINSVLDFSKIEAGRMSIESRHFHLDEVLEGVTNLLALKAQEKGLELLLSLDQNLPSALSGDPLRLGQVLTNLTGNAIKLTNEGEVVVDVRLVERIADGVRVRFAVRDTGIGLSSEQLGRLFQPFTQADESPTRRFGGTGLGLVISRQLVELMGGRLEVDSAPGAGSTFTFELALGIGDETAAATAALAPAFDVRGRRVLLVDDHETSRAVLARYLRELSFDVVGAASGTEGLAMLRDAERDGSPFDLLLLDWRMPGLDGLEVIRRLRAAPPLGKPPTIIMVTAYGREEVEKQAQALGVNELIVKPVTRSSLLDAISDAFGREPARHRLSRPPRPAAASPAFRGARVLVVEDNAINRQVARELLEAAGAMVSLANNGVEALAAIGADGVQLDAVLMDLQMPEMDGYEAARTIRKDPRHAGLPIIAMTAHAFEEERARCRDAGMDAHVSKPVDPDELFAVLGRALDRPPAGALPRHAVAPPAAPGEAPSVANLADTLPGVPGVDVATALNRLGGNRKLYVRLLLDLTRDQRDASERIARELAMGARDEAERRAHTLRGAAANLGADEVAAAARAVEEAIHKAEGVAACQAALRLLAARLEALSTAVLGRLAQPDGTQAPTPLGPSGTVADLRSLTADLETLLEKKNLRAQDALARLKQVPLPAALQEALGEIEVRVAALEYGPAVDLLRHATTRAGLVEEEAVHQ